MTTICGGGGGGGKAWHLINCCQPGGNCDVPAITCGCIYSGLTSDIFNFSVEVGALLPIHGLSLIAD